VGVIAAGVIVRKEREIVDTLRAAKAITPASAGRPDSLGIHEGVAFQRLLGRAVVREAAAGTYYLDEPSWTALRVIRRRLALGTLTLVFLLGVAGYLAAR
jgi:hypothetical protein